MRLCPKVAAARDGGDRRRAALVPSEGRRAAPRRFRVKGGRRAPWCGAPSLALAGGAGAPARAAAAAPALHESPGIGSLEVLDFAAPAAGEGGGRRAAAPPDLRRGRPTPRRSATWAREPAAAKRASAAKGDFSKAVRALGASAAARRPDPS